MADLDTMKQRLDSWREVAVLLYSVITWEQVMFFVVRQASHPILENNQIFFQILLKYFYHLNKIFINA